jgi:MYXO-CTERM domain-containing protein
VAGAAQDGVCGPVANGRGCDDGNACTRFDTCLAGTCVSAGSTCGSSNDGGTNDARAWYGETRDAALGNSLDGTTDGRAIDGIGSDRVNLPQIDALAGIDVRADAVATDSAPAVPDNAPNAIDSAPPAPDSAPIAADSAPTADSAPSAVDALTEADGGVTVVDGASGTTGSDAARSTSSTSGCNCNIGARGGSRHSLWLGLALAALLILRRRGHLDSRN